MIELVVTLLGGTGLFLLGMSLMTDGLKALAGPALRDLLTRWAGTPAWGLAAGAAATALVQSSTATTVATVGFVGAGLLSLPGAVGVVVGANLGTTSTTWLVALLGLRVSISILAFPLICAGAGLRLLARGRWRDAGVALGGFGLIFLGLRFMQDAMGGMAERIDLSALASPGVGGVLLLFGAGFVVTILMQSSSAAIATTLTALAAGAIGVQQAAALVVGQCMGTTLTAVIAAVGGSASAKRTALSHVLFNVVVVAIGLPLLHPLVALCAWFVESLGIGGPLATIACFHTTIKLAATLAVMPAAGGFVRLVERLVPERRRPAIRPLDPAMGSVASAAIEAARRSIASAMAESLRLVEGVLEERVATDHEQTRQAVEASVRDASSFLGAIAAGPQAAREVRGHSSLFHALDHVGRVARDLPERPPPGIREPRVRAVADDLRSAIAEARAWLEEPGGSADLARFERLSASIAQRRKRLRPDFIDDAVTGRLAASESAAAIEAVLWLDGLGYHLWRTLVHLQATPPPLDEPA